MLAKSFKRRNQRFNKLTASQKRVKIAQDVLKQLDMGVFTAEKMVYVKHPKAINVKQGDDLQTIYEKMPSCNVCAIGSLFVCGVLNGNEAKVEYDHTMEYNQSVDEKLYLEKYFSSDQISAIEDRFEGWDGHYNNRTLKTHSDPEVKQRLVAIMKNIIRNNGKFNQKEE